MAAGERSKSNKNGRSLNELHLFLFYHTRSQYRAVAVVMQLKRKNQNIPVPAAFLLGQMRQAAEAAINVCLARISQSADNVFPFAAQVGKFFKTIFAGKPCALLLIEPGKKFIYILPFAIAVKNFQH